MSKTKYNYEMSIQELQEIIDNTDPLIHIVLTAYKGNLTGNN